MLQPVWSADLQPWPDQRPGAADRDRLPVLARRAGRGAGARPRPRPGARRARPRCRRARPGDATGRRRAPVPAFVTRAGRADGDPLQRLGGAADVRAVSYARVRRWLRRAHSTSCTCTSPPRSLSMLALVVAEGPIVATFHTSTERSRATRFVRLLRPMLERVTARIAVSPWPGRCRWSTSAGTRWRSPTAWTCRRSPVVRCCRATARRAHGRLPRALRRAAQGDGGAARGARTPRAAAAGPAAARRRAG